MMTRKRYTKKRNIDDMMMSGRAHSPTSDCTSATSKEEYDGMSKMSTDSDINTNNDDTNSSDTSVTSSPARNINDYIDDNEDDDEYSQYVFLRNHLYFDAKAMNADHTFFNAMMVSKMEGTYPYVNEDEVERLILESVLL